MEMTYSYTINHANGDRSTSHNSYEDAEASLKAAYGDDIVFCEDWDAAGQPSADDYTERQLVWSDEGSSENDAGSNSIAEIVRRAE